MTSDLSDDLNPGNPKAIAKGCTCPPAPDVEPTDRPRSRDWDCPLHGIEAIQRALLIAAPQSNSRGEQPNLNNGGSPWSEDADHDLVWCLEHGKDIVAIADFLCRAPSEIRARMEELGLRRILVRS